MTHIGIAALIFIATLTFVIWQPRGLSIGWPATVGAILAWILHIVSWPDVLAVFHIVWDATLAFVGIILIATVLDHLGFFEWAALMLAHRARGNGRAVFFGVILLGAAVSALFANDGAALILTPIILEKIQLLEFKPRDMIPFIMAGGFVSDTTSLPFTISNLVNIVSADYFHVGFLAYAGHMVVPDLVSLAATAGFLYIYYRRDIPVRYRPDRLPLPAHAIKNPAMFRWSWWVLGILAVGYVMSDLGHFPVSLVALAIAAGFLALAHHFRVGSIRGMIQDAPWSIVVFSLGMYVVVFGVGHAGLTNILASRLSLSSRHGLIAATVITGLVAAFLSSVMNNLPTVMINALAIHAAHITPMIRQAMIYANVVGSDLGPKLTPIGSLATLLWLHVLKKRGLTITWGQYTRVGLALTIPILLVTLLGLGTWLVVVG